LTLRSCVCSNSDPQLSDDVWQDKMQKELAVEKEKNQGTLDEVEELKKHFKDRQAAYTVGFC